MDEEILPLGVMTNLRDDPFEALRKVKEMGFPTCQLANPPDKYVYGEDAKKLTEEVKKAIKETGIKISSVFIAFKGAKWNLTEGPVTIGLIPEETRNVRVVHACAISNWAKEIGVKVVTSHMGFIPKDASEQKYKGFIEIMKAFVDFCASNGQVFAFETGQETPVVLRRTIDDIGAKNIGVNLDPANLLLYGMGTPMEGVKAFGEFIVNTHCKDGKMPEASDGRLGPEMPLGQGDVNFEELIPALYKIGFRGPLTIEREISGEKQIKDILAAKKFLENIKKKL